jgi:hypothetical protein
MDEGSIDRLRADLGEADGLWPEHVEILEAFLACETQWRVRALRAPALQALDVAYMRADEAGDASAKLRIGQRKERLRQVTEHPEIEAAQSPEELAVAGLSAMVVD